MAARTAQRAGWFVLLWCGGVGAVGAVAYILRSLLTAAR
jgi:Protein of unknown function (DUF2474)